MFRIIFMSDLRGFNGTAISSSAIAGPPFIQTDSAATGSTVPAEKAFVYHGPDEDPLVSQIGKA